MSQTPTLALSIRQPWAFLIVTGQKDIENRAWGTSFRGPVWIHTGKAWGRTEKEDRLLVMEQFGLAIPLDLPLGGIVGQAEVVDCVTASPSPWFTGAFGFVLEHAQPVAFKACPGRLGFFPVDYVGLPSNAPPAAAGDRRERFKQLAQLPTLSTASNLDLFSVPVEEKRRQKKP